MPFIVGKSDPVGKKRNQEGWNSTKRVDHGNQRNGQWRSPNDQNALPKWEDNPSHFQGSFLASCADCTCSGLDRYVEETRSGRDQGALGPHPLARRNLDDCECLSVNCAAQQMKRDAFEHHAREHVHGTHTQYLVFPTDPASVRRQQDPSRQDDAVSRQVAQRKVFYPVEDVSKVLEASHWSYLGGRDKARSACWLAVVQDNSIRKRFVLD